MEIMINNGIIVAFRSYTPIINSNKLNDTPLRIKNVSIYIGCLISSSTKNPTAAKIMNPIMNDLVVARPG